MPGTGGERVIWQQHVRQMSLSGAERPQGVGCSRDSFCLEGVKLNSTWGLCLQLSAGLDKLLHRSCSEEREVYC